MHKLIGREGEISLIKSYVNKMQSFHIYGSEGVGKTATLEHVYSNWNKLHTPLIPIFCRTSSTLREMLIHIAGFLLYRIGNLQDIDKFKQIHQIRCQSDLKNINSRYLKNIIFRHIDDKKFCIIFDHLEHVTPKINALLSPLKDVAVLITASRQSWDLKDYNFTACLDYCLWLLPKVKIGKLSKNDTFSLMKLIAEDSFKVNENLFAEVYSITKGNAGLTKEVLIKALMPEYCIDGRINLGLVMLDLEIERVKEIKI
jgi:hypothetical protein